VLQAADLRYTVNPNASRLAAGRTMTVGVVVGSPASWFAGHVVAAVQGVLGVTGYDTLLYGAAGIQAGALGSRVDGLILVDGRTAGELPVDGPVVSVGLGLPDILSVTTDPVAAATVAARHLRRLGHRRISLIGHADATASTIAVEHLRAGISQALREIGVDPRGTPVVRGDASFGGRDVAVHADLTTVAQPVTKMDETAATLLLVRVEGADVTDIVLPCSLVTRGSTGRDRPSRGLGAPRPHGPGRGVPPGAKHGRRHAVTLHART
jgi:DNA-binding LacI/PurR family transcriptional regulator